MYSVFKVTLYADSSEQCLFPLLILVIRTSLISYFEVFLKLF